MGIDGSEIPSEDLIEVKPAGSPPDAGGGVQRRVDSFRAGEPGIQGVPDRTQEKKARTPEEWAKIRGGSPDDTGLPESGIVPPPVEAHPTTVIESPIPPEDRKK